MPAEKRLKVVGASQGQRTGTDGPSSSMNGPGANTSASWSGRSDTTAAYDPNRVYVRGRSATEMMSLRVPRPHQRFIEVFVAQRQHQDIETVSDFIRDAIHHRIEHWSHVIPDLDIDGLSLAAIVDEAQALAAEFELQKQVAPMWGQVLRSAMDSGDRANVLKALKKATEALGDMPRPARKQVGEQIKVAREWMKSSAVNVVKGD